MKTNNQFLIILVILFFVLLTPNIGLNHIQLAYSQNQSSSFQAEG
jgi:hypothetical protein